MCHAALYIWNFQAESAGQDQLAAIDPVEILKHTIRFSENYP